MRETIGFSCSVAQRDEPGEAKAANGRRVEISDFLPASRAARAIGANQLKLRDVAAEGARNVMILAVNVIRNCSAQRDILRSGRDGQEEPARHREVQNLRQRNARLGSQQARLRDRSRSAGSSPW